MTIKIPELDDLFSIYLDRGHELRFVGGCVRDNLLGIPTNDYDLATSMPADQSLNHLTKAGFKVIPTGLSHGTITVVIDSRPYEITTLRKDVSTDGRRAIVETTSDWAEDALRRDFTINALYQDWDGKIYDYTNGQEDLANGIVRFIGDPEDRIKEDYLRILRYFRFAQQYSKTPFPDTLSKLFNKHADRIANLSKERITQEFLKILDHPNVLQTLKDMQSCAVLNLILQDHTFDKLDKLQNTQTKLRLPVNNLLNLAALSDNFPKLRLSNAQQKYINRVQQISNEISVDNMYNFVFKEGKEITLSALLLLGDESLYRQCLEVTYKPLPISGDDLLSMGITPGSEMGRLLSIAADFWCQSKFTASKKDLIDFVNLNILSM